jgi:hypothetical protein
MLWAAAASLAGNPWALAATAAMLIGVIGSVWMSRRRMKNSVASLLTRAALACGLDPFKMPNQLPPQMKEDAKPALGEPEECSALASH